MTNGKLINSFKQNTNEGRGNMKTRSPWFWLLGLAIDPATSTLYSMACWEQQYVSLYILNSTDANWYWMSNQAWKASACYSTTKPSSLFTFRTSTGDLRLGFSWRDETKGDSIYIADGTTGQLIKTIPPSSTCPFVTVPRSP